MWEEMAPGPLGDKDLPVWWGRRGGSDGTLREKGRMSCKRLQHLLEGFPAITCVLAAPFPGIVHGSAPAVAQTSRGCLCHLSTLGKAVPTSGVALPPRQRWMAQHKLSPPKQSLRWTSPEFRQHTGILMSALKCSCSLYAWLCAQVLRFPGIFRNTHLFQGPADREVATET